MSDRGADYVPPAMFPLKRTVGSHYQINLGNGYHIAVGRDRGKREWYATVYLEGVALIGEGSNKTLREAEDVGRWHARDYVKRNRSEAWWAEYEAACAAQRASEETSMGEYEDQFDDEYEGAEIPPPDSAFGDVSFTKLPDGEWGLRFYNEEPPAPGTLVSVSKKNAPSVRKTVGEVVSRQGRVVITTIGSQAKAAKPAAPKKAAPEREHRPGVDHKGIARRREPTPQGPDADRARANAEVLWNGGTDEDGKRVYPLDEDQDLISKWQPADGHLRVLAAAGSGKTRTTVALVARLIWREILRPEEIIVTTFTNKAGGELRRRFLPVLPPGTLGRMRVGTFHSIAIRAATAAFPQRLPRGRNIDGKDGPIPAWMLWGQIVNYVPRKTDARTGKVKSKYGSDQGYVFGTSRKPLDLKDEKGRPVRAGDYKLAVDVARAEPGDDRAVAERLAQSGLPSAPEAWAIYCEAKKAIGAWDFADALAVYEEALRERQIRDAVKLIVVDEAQDNNRIQFEIAKHLARNGNGSIILVGDVRQAIYSWRGAEPKIMIGADEEIGAKTLEIRHNYRSGAKIVALGNAICEGEEWSIGSPAEPSPGAKPGVITVSGAEGAVAESGMVAQKIASLREAGALDDLSDVAILSRTNAMGAAAEAALVSLRIPAATTGTPFFARVEPKAVLAWIRLVTGESVNADDVSRLVRFPKRGLGEVYVTNVVERMNQRQEPFLDAALGVVGSLYSAQRDTAEEFAIGVKSLVEDIPGEIAEAIADGKPNAEVMLWHAKITALKAYLAQAFASGEDEEVEKEEEQTSPAGMAAATLEVAQKFDSGPAFFRFAAQCAGEELVDGKVAVEETQYRPLLDENGNPMLDDNGNVKLDYDAPIKSVGRVIVSTIHKAKGLEWPIVFVSATAGIFPSKWSENPDEEKRLFYVAVTRAERECHLTYREREPDAKPGSPGGPSPFLAYAEGLVEG